MESKIFFPISSYFDQKHKAAVYDIPGSVVEFCPFEQSSSLLAVGSKQGIILLRRIFSEIDELGDASKFQQFKESWCLQQLLYLQLGTKVTSIAFSPTTYIDLIDSEKIYVTLAIGCEENSARFLKLSSKAKDPKIVMLGGTSGHQDFINDVDTTYLNIIAKADETEFTGDIVATGGDDCTVIVWRMTDNSPQLSAYSTGSPVISVKFHRSYPRRLLVGEYNGTIKILDWVEAGGKWLISLYAGLTPYNFIKSNSTVCLADVDWASNKDDIGRIIAATTDGLWLLWDFDGKSDNISILPTIKKRIGSEINVKQLISRPGYPDIFAICLQRSLMISLTSHIKLVNIFSSTDLIDIELPLSEISKPEDSYISWHANEGIIAISRNSSLIISCVMNNDDFFANMSDFMG
ncbi:hypothetical protein PNEG_00241 [Pneumocystis murina B123]|uniref:Anaphase-promoting complex subunit 4 WD40 domain-containing protein n=1 Tax=Pneumocystis murina (strain B123) TaxID=1069680 RepID=M7PD57_PNEMU|nr:hypothetical protein PNEG_00241 [Pneumocystis murina B123]EMR11815.1 hypothetical protein PNEG_00241 [Pneumocystis murina B123]